MMITINITCPHCKTTWAPESVAESVYCKVCKIFITKYKMSMDNSYEHLAVAGHSGSNSRGIT